MDFYIDYVTGARVNAPSATFAATVATDTPSAKLQSVQAIRIQYVKNNAPCAAPSGTIKFGLKQIGHFSATTFDVYTDSFTSPADPTLPYAYYTGTLTIDSVALRALFPVGSDGTSADSVTLIGEILSGTLPSETFNFVARNNVIKGTESPAVAIPGSPGYAAPAAVNAAIGQAGDVMVIQCPDSIGGDFSVDGGRGTAVITDRSGNQEIAFIFGASTLTALQLTGAGVLGLPPLPPGLLIVDLSFNALGQAAMAAIVNQLYAAGLTGGYLNLYSQASGETLDAPALANLAIMTNSRSWSVVL